MCIEAGGLVSGRPPSLCEKRDEIDLASSLRTCVYVSEPSPRT
jgi:hypothetical protein